MIHLQRGKRVSKVRILQKAIDYITNMHIMVANHDGVPAFITESIFDSRQNDSNLFAF